MEPWNESLSVEFVNMRGNNTKMELLKNRKTITTAILIISFSKSLPKLSFSQFKMQKEIF